MKLHWSPRSPFVRKVMIALHELGLNDRVALTRTVVATTTPHLPLMEENPLSKIPTLVLDDGTVLYDSPVICEYLDSLHAGPKLIPIDLESRMIALRRQALGDGFLDFLLLLRNERERKHPSEAHVATFNMKRQAVLAALDKDAGALAAAPFGIGHIAIGCALSYLDFRFAADDWRADHPRIARWHREFCARPSVQATEPVDDSSLPIPPPTEPGLAGVPHAQVGQARLASGEGVEGGGR
jgi:glutathione S-transferase